jgi:hypothetical protein
LNNKGRTVQNEDKNAHALKSKRPSWTEESRKNLVQTSVKEHLQHSLQAKYTIDKWVYTRDTITLEPTKVR